MPRIGLIGKRQYRLSYETRFESGWRFRNRLEYIVFREESSPREHGWMVFQDLFYQPLGSAFSGNLRLALFSTSSYETRIYAFENDVLYAGSFPMYHNRGIRAYLNGRWKVGRRTDLWMRYAVSRYRGVSEIGSGLDQLSGPLRSELKTQLRIKIP